MGQAANRTDWLSGTSDANAARDGPRRETAPDPPLGAISAFHSQVTLWVQNWRFCGSPGC